MLTTHAIDEAEQLADAVVIVDAGRVVAAGSPASLTQTGGAPRELRFDAPAGLPLDDLLATLPPGTDAVRDGARSLPGHRRDHPGPRGGRDLLVRWLEGCCRTG